MSTFLASHKGDEIDKLIDEATDIAHHLLCGTKRIAAPTETLRKYVTTFYGEKHFRVSQGGYATYSTQFYQQFEHFRYNIGMLTPPATEDEEEKNVEEIKSSLSEDDKEEEDNDAPSLLPISEDKEESSEEESETEAPKQASDDETEEGALGANTIDNDDDEQEDFIQMADSLQQKIRVVSHQLRTWEESEEEQKFRAVLATPSPRRQERKEDERSQSDTPGRMEQTLQQGETDEECKRRRKRTTEEIKKRFEQITARLDRHNERFDSHDMKNESRFDVLQKMIEDQREETKKLQGIITKQDRRIVNLEIQLEEIANPDEDIEEYRQQATELVEETKEQVNQLEIRGDKFLEKIQRKCQDQINDLNDMNKKLERTASNIDKAFQPMVTAQLRAFETKLTQLSQSSHAKTLSQMKETRKNCNKAINERGAKILEKCKALLDDTKEISIANLDAIAAECEAAKNNIIARFKNEFLQDIQQKYSEEKQTYTNAISTVAEIAMKREENRIAKFATDKAEAILQDSTFGSTLTAKIQQQVDTAQKQLESIKDELEERKAEMKATISDFTDDMRKKIAKEGTQAIDDLDTTKTAGMDSFGTLVKLEKGIIQNLAATEVQKIKDKNFVKNITLTEKSNKPKGKNFNQALMSLFNGEPPTTKIIGTPNLVGSIYDYAGGNPGDPDDDPPDDDPGDDNSSHHSPSTTDTNSKEAKKPRSRNFKAKADKYQESLQKFADKYKFTELCGTIWDATTSINIYTAVRRAMYNLTPSLLHHSELVPNGACIHPEDAAIVNSLGPGLLQETSDILYEKLNVLIDSDDKSAREVLNIYYISQNGYKALYDLMQRYQEHLQVNPEMWSTPWKPTQTVFEYVGDMIAIRHRKQARSKQKYTDDQMKMELILQSRSLPQFQTISTTILFLVD